MVQSSEVKIGKIQIGNPVILGARQMGRGYNFAVVVKEGEAADLLLYKKGSSKVVKEIQLPTADRIGNVSAVFIEEIDAAQYEYNYKMNGQIVQDPYARALTGRREFGVRDRLADEHGVRCCLYENSPLKKQSVFIPYEDAVIYKLHVRGYTMHKLSKVKEKGTFSGLQRKIPYLKALGVTSVELMPAYDFNETADILQSEEQKFTNRFASAATPALNYWGYTGGFYFAPKSAYCAGEDPALEFQSLVDTLHKSGMECLMEFYFAADTRLVFMLDVLHFWKLVYGVDGFHLTGEIPIEMLAQDPVLQGTKLLYAGFDIGKIYQNHKKKQKTLGAYNQGFMETMRRFLRGDEDQVSGVIWHIKNNPLSHGVINYMTCQDGFTLQDLVSYDYRHNEENGENNRDGSAYNYSWNCGVEGPTRKLSVLELRKKQIKNSILFMLLSQGTPMIYGGDELANTQNGNNNAYCQDNATGWVDWGKSKRSAETLVFMKEAISFRKRHRILHVDHEVRDTDYRVVGTPEISFHSQRAWDPNMESASRQIGIMYCSTYAQEASENYYIYMAYNMHWEVQEFALPKIPASMQWYLAINTDEKDGSGIYTHQQQLEGKRNIMVPPRTIIVLIGRQEENET